jgi:hypothetical protein
MNLQRFTFCLLACAILVVTACTTGTAIVTGTVRTPLLPEQVTIYLEPPTDFEVIGLVDASSEAGWSEQESLNYAIEELKKQAAKLGANGVLLVSSGEKITGFLKSGPVMAKTVQGKAIFVDRK